MQPLMKDGKTVRFKPNHVVLKLLELAREHGIGLSEILLREYAQQDVEQFYQLLGYSLDMYEELSFISDKSVAVAKRRALDIDRGKEHHFVLLARDWVRDLAKRFRADSDCTVMALTDALDMADDTLGMMIANETIRERDLTHSKRVAFQNEFVRCLRKAKYIDPSDRKDPREDLPRPKCRRPTLMQDLDFRRRQKRASSSTSREPGK